MPEALMPDSMARTLSDLNRRLAILEATQRVGLSGVRNAWQTATAATATFGTFESGPAGTTWQDDQGATGSGYPTLTITNMPARAWIVWEARPADVGATPGATYKCNSAQFCLAINGLTDYTTLPGGILPKTNRSYVNADNGTNRQMIFASAMRLFTAGSTYTFQMQANWFNATPGNPTSPTLTDCQIIVLPLSAA
jgi:hypothetical protein